MRDIFLSKIGQRPTGARVWIEDGFSRLQRNGFGVGVPIDVLPRSSGAGLIIRVAKTPTRRKVAKRRGMPLLSLEGPQVLACLPWDEVRVRVSVGAVAVLPRAFALLFRMAVGVAVISGTTVRVGGVVRELVNARAVKLPEGGAECDFYADEDNVFWGCEFVSNHRPGLVRVHGVEKGLVEAYLCTMGYQPDENGDLRL